MTFKKYCLKNIIASVLLIAILAFIGIECINSISEIELQKSTYTRTLFDIHIASPDKAQVDSIESDASVDGVFPYYAYSRAFAADKEIILLISDDMADSVFSVLTEETLIEGTYDENGAMLDKRAADALGVKVGDSVTFSLVGKSFTKTVSAIYLPSEFAILNRGIVLVAATDEIASVSTPKAYGGAFVSSNDIAKTEALLEGYVGEGNVSVSYEHYVETQCPSMLPWQTEEEYEAECRKKYEAYRTERLESAKKNGGQVVRKSEAYALVKNKILAAEKGLKSLADLGAIASFALLCLVLIIFTVTNVGNDRIRRDTGMRASEMIASYSVSSLVTAIVVSGISALILFAFANSTYFAEECAATIWKITLPVLASIPVSVLAAIIYVKLLYVNLASGHRERDE